MFSPWRSEYYWLIWLGLVGLFAGKLTGWYLPAFWICCLIYLGHHLANIHSMLMWLRTGGKIPSGSGIWEEIYYLIYRLRRRNKARKKRLLQMLERFRTATAALPDATVVLGPRDEIDWFNEAAGKLLGFRKSDLGQQVSNLIRYPKFAEFLRASNYTETMNMPSPAAERTQLEIRVVPYGEDLRLLLAQDVTQLRFMERVRTDFVANVSHELRTPLTVLRGYVETLDAASEMSERHRKIFNRMQEQTERMQNLIDGLLSLTRLESTHSAAHAPVDVPSMLRSICDEYQVADNQQATLELRLDTAAHLSGAESELRSVFSNLIGNAVKYTPANGHIQVRWREERDQLIVDVEDDGPGIALEHLPRLTERFYRVETEGVPRTSGAGLGLAIVKHAMSRHDGELKIRSRPGKGSCFSCIFPIGRAIRIPDQST
jgi:two-component system phosphate regulon sensor histidine kinase PhoR